MTNCAQCCSDSDLAKPLINKTSKTKPSYSALKKLFLPFFCLWHFPSHQTNQTRCKKKENENWVEKIHTWELCKRFEETVVVML